RRFLCRYCTASLVDHGSGRRAFADPRAAHRAFARHGAGRDFGERTNADIRAETGRGCGHARDIRRIDPDPDRRFYQRDFRPHTGPALMIAPGFADVEAQIWMWLMGMIRRGAAMVVAPVFGAANVPLQVRIILAFMFGLVASNSATFALPTDTAISGSNLIFVMGEVLVGLAMGFSLQIGYASVLIAGATISNAMGLGFASMSDPQTGQSTPVIGQFLTILATLLLLAIDGHLMLIATIVKSYSALPPGYAFLGPELFMGIVQFGGTLFSMGLLKIGRASCRERVLVEAGAVVIKRIRRC